MNCVLLLGAGFSCNWGGLPASHISDDLLTRVGSDDYLRSALQAQGFEDALAQTQLNAAMNSTDESRMRLSILQSAISELFNDMNESFAKRTDFTLNNDRNSALPTYLTRFDSIFTLNQDVLIELHYLHPNNIPIWSNGRFNGGYI